MPVAGAQAWRPCNRGPGTPSHRSASIFRCVRHLLTRRQARLASAPSPSRPRLRVTVALLPWLVMALVKLCHSMMHLLPANRAAVLMQGPELKSKRHQSSNTGDHHRIAHLPRWDHRGPRIRDLDLQRAVAARLREPAVFVHAAIPMHLLRRVLSDATLLIFFICFLRALIPERRENTKEPRLLAVDRTFTNTL